MPKRQSTQIIVALWGLAFACDGLAFGFGTAPESVTFGRPLDLSIPLNLRPGETLESPCVNVEVEIGERRLPRRSIQASVEPSGADKSARSVRIRSSQVVDEPVVAVSVSAGCADKVARQFTVFADPAEWAAPTAVAVASSFDVPAEGSAASPAGHTAPGALQANPNAALDRPPESRRKVPPRGERTPRRDYAEVRATSAAAASALARPPAALPPKAKATAGAAPRLLLDRDDRLDVAGAALMAGKLQLEEALARAAAVQADAATAAAAAEQRLASIERDMQQLRSAALASQSSDAQLRARLVAAEGLNGLLPVLAVVLAVLVGVAAWLALRLRALHNERQHSAWAGLVEAAPVDRAEQSSSASETLQMPSSVLTGQGHATVSPTQAAAAMVVIKEPIEPAQQRPMMAPVAELVTATESAAAQLSSPAGVEELIDLEQQVEFFAVLGQDESAVDLLMTHLRATGGASPLPYLKLLEIYRRCDDRVAYDRTRTRFNQRFNANAPEWHSDPAQGRTLLEYGDVMSRLQAIWGTPVDAMAELETLLLRRSKGGLFDLPAYRDVLMLYGVARELHRSGDAAAQDVDVMLPLGADDQAHRAVALHLLFSHADGGEVRNEDRPTAPVDLDLSLSPLSRDSIFGVLSPVGASLRSH